eukprot:Gregarina_sp_Pseudo_9__1339@NODE_1899_length_1267_cov_13_449511_g1761_i0_p4_GENE_NODE_1899_length_1267_cov_13_449511_g1761_i0NODE_1899_length_1267_cov_13_449511_g1761_i0_p4_ORF_typecomplete_len120_score14_98GTPbdg_M/PF16360_5/0_026GTPbdg_M/PF16360_5/2_8e03_NODE_1899_length_1267_cov_13_449511_g1761_i0575934
MGGQTFFCPSLKERPALLSSSSGAARSSSSESGLAALRLGAARLRGLWGALSRQSSSSSETAGETETRARLAGRAGRLAGGWLAWRLVEALRGSVTGGSIFSQTKRRKKERNAQGLVGE